MPFPVPEASHAAHPLTADVGRKHGTKPVPRVTHRLMADVDHPLEQQVSTFLSDSRKRTYIITTSRITSGDELK
jgi:hypothetical protein